MFLDVYLKITSLQNVWSHQKRMRKVKSKYVLMKKLILHVTTVKITLIKRYMHLNKLPAHSHHHFPQLPQRILGGSRHSYWHPRCQADSTASGLEGRGPVRDIPRPAQGVWRLGQVQVPGYLRNLWRGTPSPLDPIIIKIIIFISSIKTIETLFSLFWWIMF